jgi:hypothetical protein
MRNDFAVFILSHGRPDRVETLGALERAGYTGRTYIVIDDEDPQGEEYRKRYGEKVLVFSKEAVAREIDEGIISRPAGVLNPGTPFSASPGIGAPELL